MVWRMIRTQIQLTEKQAKALKALAAKTGVSMAELVRRGVDEVLRSPQVDDDERWKRARAAVGGFRSGHGDIAENHDRYLAEDILAKKGG